MKDKKEKEKNEWEQWWRQTNENKWYFELTFMIFN